MIVSRPWFCRVSVLKIVDLIHPLVKSLCASISKSSALSRFLVFHSKSSVVLDANSDISVDHLLKVLLASIANSLWLTPIWSPSMLFMMTWRHFGQSIVSNGAMLISASIQSPTWSKYLHVYYFFLSSSSISSPAIFSLSWMISSAFSWEDASGFFESTIRVWILYSWL